MDALILAGGLGTRLKSVVSSVPKPMAPIGEKPFLEYLLKYLITQGIKKVIIGVGYKKETIINYFGNRYNEIDIIYSNESEPLGTGGAIKNALDKIETSKFLLINGDTFFNVNIKELDELFEKNKADIALSLKKMYDFDRYGTVVTDENNSVLGFSEKTKTQEGFINGGVYIVNKEIFNTIMPEKFSFEKEILENVSINIKIVAKEFDNYFIDIGIPNDYEKAQRELANE